MEFIIESLVEKANELGFDFDERDVIYDDSRSYGLYVDAYCVGLDHACRKFGAWRDYLGGFLRDAIDNSGRYIPNKEEKCEELRILGQVFEDALREIESLEYYDDFAEHVEDWV